MCLPRLSLTATYVLRCHHQINPSSIGQDKHEEVLCTQLAKTGHLIKIGVDSELLHFEQFLDHVEVLIVNALGKQSTMQVGWIVSADGAHGVVQCQLGLPFVGVSRTKNIVVGNLYVKYLPLDNTVRILSFSIHMGKHSHKDVGSRVFFLTTTNV